jgi:hypothetical protein
MQRLGVRPPFQKKKKLHSSIPEYQSDQMTKPLSILPRKNKEFSEMCKCAIHRDLACTYSRTDYRPPNPMAAALWQLKSTASFRCNGASTGFFRCHETPLPLHFRASREDDGGMWRGATHTSTMLSLVAGSLSCHEIHSNHLSLGDKNADKRRRQRFQSVA